ncbi:hypothetical protein F5146DRAFT_1028858 [Armillaria mellea]|nr:hypothetical protein F5146DRAFT_1028858 [Armillaria mellea]
MPKAGRRKTRNSNKSGIFGEGESPTSKTGHRRSKRDSKGSQALESETAALVKSSDEPIMPFMGKTGEGSDISNKPSHPGGRSVQSSGLSVQRSADETTDSEGTSEDGELQTVKNQLQALLCRHRSLKKKYEELKTKLGNNDRLRFPSESGMQEHRALTPGPGESLPVPLIFNIRNMVESLNNDMVTLCSSIADELSGDLLPMAPHPLTVDAVPAVGHIIDVVGHHFTHLLLYKTYRRRLIVLLALQSVLSKTCVDHEEQNTLRCLYYQLLIHSPDIVGHWRATTRTKSKHAGSMSTSCERHLIDGILRVLVTAGWSDLNAEETVKNRYGQRVKDLVELIVKLDKAMGEDVVSQELNVYIVRPDVPFAPALMTDQNHEASGGISANGWVAVCTGIGLAAKCREPKDGGNIVGGVGFKEQVLLKSKVILRSALE